MEVKASNVAYAPINGMPHLAYLGQMLEKEGGFGIGIFPEGLVLSRVVKTSRKYMNSCGLMTIVTNDLYTSSTQIVYIYSLSLC